MSIIVIPIVKNPLSLNTPNPLKMAKKVPPKPPKPVVGKFTKQLAAQRKSTPKPAPPRTSAKPKPIVGKHTAKVVNARSGFDASSKFKQKAISNLKPANSNKPVAKPVPPKPTKSLKALQQQRQQMAKKAVSKPKAPPAKRR